LSSSERYSSLVHTRPPPARPPAPPATYGLPPGLLLMCVLNFLAALNDECRREATVSLCARLFVLPTRRLCDGVCAAIAELAERRRRALGARQRAAAVRRDAHARGAAAVAERGASEPSRLRSPTTPSRSFRAAACGTRCPSCGCAPTANWSCWRAPIALCSHSTFRRRSRRLIARPTKCFLTPCCAHLERCCFALLDAFRLDGGDFVLEFRPRLYLSVVAQMGLPDTFWPLLQCALLTSRSVVGLLLTVRRRLDRTESRAAARSQRTVYRGSAGADLAAALQNAAFVLKLMPERARSLLVLICDGAISLPDTSAYDNLLMLLNREAIACSSVQIGAGFAPSGAFGYVPDCDVLRHLAVTTHGCFFTARRLAAVCNRQTHAAYDAYVRRTYSNDPNCSNHIDLDHASHYGSGVTLQRWRGETTAMPDDQLPSDTAASTVASVSGVPGNLLQQRMLWNGFSPARRYFAYNDAYRRNGDGAGSQLDGPLLAALPRHPLYFEMLPESSVPLLPPPRSRAVSRPPSVPISFAQSRTFLPIDDSNAHHKDNDGDDVDNSISATPPTNMACPLFGTSSIDAEIVVPSSAGLNRLIAVNQPFPWCDPSAPVPLLREPLRVYELNCSVAAVADVRLREGFLVDDMERANRLTLLLPWVANVIIGYSVIAKKEADIYTAPVRINLSLYACDEFLNEFAFMRSNPRRRRRRRRTCIGCTHSSPSCCRPTVCFSCCTRASAPDRAWRRWRRRQRSGAQPRADRRGRRRTAARGARPLAHAGVAGVNVVAPLAEDRAHRYLSDAVAHGAATGRLLAVRGARVGDGDADARPVHARLVAQRRLRARQRGADEALRALGDVCALAAPLCALRQQRRLGDRRRGGVGGGERRAPAVRVAQLLRAASDRRHRQLGRAERAVCDARRHAGRPPAHCGRVREPAARAGRRAHRRVRRDDCDRRRRAERGGARAGARAARAHVAARHCAAARALRAARRTTTTTATPCTRSRRSVRRCRCSTRTCTGGAACGACAIRFCARCSSTRWCTSACATACSCRQRAAACSR
jgi:hypothetical protein